MTNTKRVIPKWFNNYYLNELKYHENRDSGNFEYEEERISDEEYYEKLVTKIETRAEKELIAILKQLGIEASTKSERFSLPYQYEIVTVKQYCDRLFWGINLVDLMRKVTLMLLVKKIYKIRFYVFLQLETPTAETCQASFYFRYYVHKNKEIL